MDDIAKARKLIWDALEKDEGFKWGYTSNVAMILYDELGLDYEQRNTVANKILAKVFKG